MNVLYGMLIFAFAGAMNGSFALPSKHLKHWSYQRIWLNYSLWAFLIFPCLFLTFLAPHAWRIYANAPAHLLAIIVAGGFLFGVGQICFSRALHMIGIGMGFVINISIGTALGSLVPFFLLRDKATFTQPELVTVAGICFILFGVLLSYIAGLKRDRAQHNTTEKNNYALGIMLATVAGIFSAGQNVTFSYTHSLQDQALASGISHFVSANIIWPAFLIATFIPYVSYMLILRYKNRDSESTHRSIRYYFSTLVMGAFWFFSLILYSAGSLKIGTLGPVIGWPLFMVCIILTANMWGWRHGEWALAPSRAKTIAKLSIIALITSILILAYATFLSI